LIKRNPEDPTCLSQFGQVELFNLETFLMSPGFESMFSVNPETLTLAEDREKYEEFIDL
jgi:hypothetical protein